jgi:DNA polymerase III epsilon subunit-like protein
MNSTMQEQQQQPVLSQPVPLDKQQQLVVRHPHRKRIMVFDVETTGLLPKKDPLTKLAPTIQEFPHILQLSFVIYNTKFWTIERTFDKYIRVADSVDISAKITELTGITRALCNETTNEKNSMSIEDALAEFYQEYLACDCIVAHNIDFDRTMIMTELERNKAAIVLQCPYYSCIFDHTFNTLHNIDTFCTMRVGKKICNIVIQPGNKIDPKTGLATIVPKPFVKYPRLSELHQHLFGSVPEGLHNSLVDTMACLRCFLFMRFKGNPRFPLRSHPL